MLLSLQHVMYNSWCHLSIVFNSIHCNNYDILPILAYLHVQLLSAAVLFMLTLDCSILKRRKAD